MPSRRAGRCNRFAAQGVARVGAARWRSRAAACAVEGSATGGMNKLPTFTSAMVIFERRDF